MSSKVEKLIKEVKSLEFEDQLKVASSLESESSYSLLKSLATGMGYDTSNPDVDNAIMGLACNDSLITDGLEYKLSTVLSEIKDSL